MGSTALGNAGLDAIVLLGDEYNSIIYVGGVRSNIGRTVVGVGNPALNSFVFASGALSGASTALEVTIVNRFENIGGQTIGPGFWTEDPTQRGSVGNGDSGGPVAQAADLVTVNARGMIDAIDLGSEVECERCRCREAQMFVASVPC